MFKLSNAQMIFLVFKSQTTGMEPSGYKHHLNSEQSLVASLSLPHTTGNHYCTKPLSTLLPSLLYNSSFCCFFFRCFFFAVRFLFLAQIILLFSQASHKLMNSCSLQGQHLGLSDFGYPIVDV